MTVNQYRHLVPVATLLLGPLATGCFTASLAGALQATAGSADQPVSAPPARRLATTAGMTAGATPTLVAVPPIAPPAAGLPVTDVPITPVREVRLAHATTSPVQAGRLLGATVPAEPAQDDQPRKLRATDLHGIKWRSVGPANMGGRVADLAMAPGNPKILYVGYATGGLWKSTNGGTTFAPVFDKEATSSIGAVAVVDAPSSWPGWATVKQDDSDKPLDRAKAGKARIVWVGTGEGNDRNSSSWGNGVYRSTDGGKTFTQLGLAETHNIPELAVDPRDPDICYVAAMGHLWGTNPQRGLYKTTDGGSTWQAVLQVDDTTGCCDVLIDPTEPDRVYAVMYRRLRHKYGFAGGGPEGGVFRSEDAGATWTRLTKGLPASTGRIGLDLCRSKPNIVYASVESDEGGRRIDEWNNFSAAGGVFRSDDHGSSWTRVSNLAPRSFYFSRIRVDPVDDQRVYLLGWNIYVSTNGGRDFRDGLTKITHVDHHTMIINPDDPEHLVIGNDGGVYVSYDRGSKWDFLNHVAAGQFYNVTVDGSEPYRIGGGLQDNGSWIGPSATNKRSGRDSLGNDGVSITNADWFYINNGDGFHVAFHPDDANIIFAESQGGHLVRVHLDTGRRKALKPSPREGQPGYRFNWNAPFFISPHDADVLYLGGNHVFKLTDRGDRWTQISPDLSSGELDKMIAVGSDAETYGTIVALAESTLTRGMLWAGTDDGLIHLSTDDGATWQNVTPPQADSRYVSKIEPSRHDVATAYAAIDGHRSDDFRPTVLMTVDRGGTWRDISGNLPPGDTVKVIREDWRNPAVLYAGSERACWLTIDRGSQWIKLNADTLPTVAVDDLVMQPTAYDLVAGTHGRSIWVLDDVSPLAQLSAEVIGAKLHLFDLPDARPRIYLPYAGLWTHRLFTASNPPDGGRITYWLRDFVDEIKITITDEGGTTVASLTGSNRPGINRAFWDLQPERKQRLENPEAFLGQTHFVPAGTYRVRVAAGDDSVTGKLTVLPSPIADDLRK